MCWCTPHQHIQVDMQSKMLTRIYRNLAGWIASCKPVLWQMTTLSNWSFVTEKGPNLNHIGSSSGYSQDSLLDSPWSWSMYDLCPSVSRRTAIKHLSLNWFTVFRRMKMRHTRSLPGISSWSPILNGQSKSLQCGSPALCYFLLGFRWIFPSV